MERITKRDHDVLHSRRTRVRGRPTSKSRAHAPLTDSACAKFVSRVHRGGGGGGMSEGGRGKVVVGRVAIYLPRLAEVKIQDTIQTHSSTAK